MSLGIEILIETVGYVCEYVMQLLCIHAFLGKKVKCDLKTIFTGVLFVSILLSALHFDTSYIITMIPHLVMAVYVYLEHKLKIMESVVVVLLNILISTAVQIIAILPVSFFDDIFSKPYTLVAFIQVLSLIVMIIVIRIIKLDVLYNKTIKWDKMIIKTLGIVLLLFFYLYIRCKIEEQMIVLAYFISALMICVVVKIALDWNKDRYEIKQKSLELHMHELYGKTFEGMIENIRIRQHDFKNQLAAIYGMHLTADNFEDLVESQKKYCDYLMEESRYDSILTKCNDKILAGFLYTKFNEWEKKGIDFRFDISLNNSKCKLATYELIEISGILIDNAAEAETANLFSKSVEFVIEDTEETVRIISRNQSEYVSMDVINKFFKKGYSTKGDNRGLGLYDVKKLLDGKGEIIVRNTVIDEENYIEFRIEIKR